MLRKAWPSTSADDPTGSLEAKPMNSRAWLIDFRTGLLTNVLNPKVAIFFLAFLPQFVPAASHHKTASFLLLGLWFVVQSTLFLLVLVAVVQRLRSWGASAGLRRLMHLVGGGLFIALALRLLRERPTLA
jgi:threonine/homoserine/homoserine lactone efflux protein